MKPIRENTHIVENVTTTLTDAITGATRSFTTHNIPCNGQFSALAQWVSGLVANIGYNNVPPPSQIEYGSGTGTPQSSDTGPFTPISGSLTNLSYAQANTPQAGTTTLVFQTAAGVVTTQITEAFLRDSSGRAWGHLLYGAPFTPSSTETITTQWELTYSA